MATYPQLQAEPWWGAEFEPPTLAKLNRDLRSFYKTDAIHIGSKGDNRHLRGYHRSRAWIQNSIYCTNRSYSIKETSGNARGGDSNWLAATDFQPPISQQLYDACRRFDEAVRAGRLEKITQWFGSFDGKTVVGYNNVGNVSATSDSSHLWHLHLSFDRGRANEDHSDLFAVLTGGEDVALEETVPQTGGRNLGVVMSDLYNHLLAGHSGYVPTDVAFTPAHLAKILADVEELKTRPPVEVDAAALAAALIADPAFAAMLKQQAFEGAQQAERE